MTRNKRLLLLQISTGLEVLATAHFAGTPTLVLQHLLGELLQLAELVSDELDERGHGTSPDD